MRPANLDRWTDDVSSILQPMPDITPLAAFIGPGATSYLSHFGKQRKKAATTSSSAQPHKLPIVISWHWPAFALTIPWMFYRKMYTGGIILIALPVFLDHILPGSLFLGSGLLIAVIAGLCGKSWYLEHAMNRFAKARRTFDDDAAQSIYLQRAGGVSLSAGIFGALVQGVTATVIVFDLLPPSHF